MARARDVCCIWMLPTLATVVLVTTFTYTQIVLQLAEPPVEKQEIWGMGEFSEYLILGDGATGKIF